MPRPLRFCTAAVATVLLFAACGGGGGSKENGPVALRLGYFPNLTHAAALVGVANGIFAKDLGKNVTLKTSTFNAGPEALFSGALDATYVGPNPAINAYQKSNGQAVRIIAGATSGGAALVVRPTISSAADLKGKKIASPQLGNTQDVALRSWLKKQGLNTTPEGGGDVQVLPQENSQTLDTFKSGQIDGAWVPEPWATRLVLEGKGKVLVDESTLWPGGRFLTTTLIVRTAFLNQHPDVVRNLLKGHVDATKFVNQNPALAQQIELARLYHATQARATQLSAISEVSKTITSNLYLEEILQLIVAMTAVTGNFEEAVREIHQQVGFVQPPGCCRT